MSEFCGLSIQRWRRSDQISAAKPMQAAESALPVAAMISAGVMVSPLSGTAPCGDGEIKHNSYCCKMQCF